MLKVQEVKMRKVERSQRNIQGGVFVPLAAPSLRLQAKKNQKQRDSGASVTGRLHQHSAVKLEPHKKNQTPLRSSRVVPNL